MSPAKDVQPDPTTPRWFRIVLPCLVAGFVLLGGAFGMRAWQGQAEVDRAHRLVQQWETAAAKIDRAPGASSQAPRALVQSMLQTAKAAESGYRNKVLWNAGFAIVYLAIAGVALRGMRRRRSRPQP
jgi:hypothetical protein